MDVICTGIIGFSWYVVYFPLSNTSFTVHFTYVCTCVPTPASSKKFKRITYGNQQGSLELNSDFNSFKGGSTEKSDSGAEVDGTQKIPIISEIRSNGQCQ